jgi:hypothetical protein
VVWGAEVRRMADKSDQEKYRGEGKQNSERKRIGAKSREIGFINEVGESKDFNKT